MAKHSTMKVGLLTKKKNLIWNNFSGLWKGCMGEVDEVVQTCAYWGNKTLKKLGHAQGDMW
jgi:hypothetical protein